MVRVFIGIGTNIGNREENLKDSIKYLEVDFGMEIIKKSSVVEAAPVDYKDQPDFLNQVVMIKTDYEPEKLLEVLKEIEVRMGREPGIPKGPRVIDLDILLYDDIIFDTDELKIPHPEILRRKFVLDHLLELDPDLVDPINMEKFREVNPGWLRSEL